MRWGLHTLSAVGNLVALLAVIQPHAPWWQFALWLLGSVVSGAATYELAWRRSRELATKADGTNGCDTCERIARGLEEIGANYGHRPELRDALSRLAEHTKLHACGARVLFGKDVDG